MPLSLNNLHCALPGVGHVLGPLDLDLATSKVTGVVGRSGAGASTLLRALGGALPPGSQLSGAARLDKSNLLRANQAELQARVLLISDSTAFAATTRALLTELTSDVSGLADGLNLTKYLDRPASALPLDLRAGLSVALAELGPTADLVLVDQVSSAASPQLRDRLGNALRERATEGATVVWAEHNLDDIWAHCDHVLELSNGTAVYHGPADTWDPQTLPAPTMLSLARLLGLPANSSHAAADFQSVLGPSLLSTAPPAGRPTRRSAAITHTFSPEDLGVHGSGLDLRSGETIGLVRRDGRSENTAARLVPASGRLTTRFPASTSLASYLFGWENQNRLAPGTISKQLPSLRSYAPARQHSLGDLAILRKAMGIEPAKLLWLPHPQWGLDAVQRQLYAHELANGSANGPRIITSRDTEFLVRACSRILVIDGDDVIADGTPEAVAPRLPETTLVAEALGNNRFLRISNVLEAINTGTSVAS